MASSSNDDVQTSAGRLLRTAAFVIGAIGLAMASWGVDKWIEMPGARASQLGFQAPLWPAFTLFVVVCTALVVWLLWTAAERVRTGADLFDERHRRHPGEPDSPSD